MSSTIDCPVCAWKHRFRAVVQCSRSDPLRRPSQWNNEHGMQCRSSLYLRVSRSGHTPGAGRWYVVFVRMCRDHSSFFFSVADCCRRLHLVGEVVAHSRQQVRNRSRGGMERKGGRGRRTGRANLYVRYRSAGCGSTLLVSTVVTVTLLHLYIPSRVAHHA